MDENSLIEASKKGDLDSFNQLVLSYQGLLYNQAFRLMGEYESAEDATQEAFISAFKKIYTYRGGSFKAWLMRIVTNACYDELRRRKRRPQQPLIPMSDSDEEIESAEWLADDSDSPEEMAERSDIRNSIQDCINGLPDHFKSIFILVDVQQFNYTETAETVGIPVGTVKSRLSRARLQMRDCLKSVELLN